MAVPGNRVSDQRPQRASRQVRRTAESTPEVRPCGGGRGTMQCRGTDTPPPLPQPPRLQLRTADSSKITPQQLFPLKLTRPNVFGGQQSVQFNSTTKMSFDCHSKTIMQVQIFPREKGEKVMLGRRFNMCAPGYIGTRTPPPWKDHCLLSIFLQL